MKVDVLRRRPQVDGQPGLVLAAPGQGHIVPGEFSSCRRVPSQRSCCSCRLRQPDTGTMAPAPDGLEAGLQQPGGPGAPTAPGDSRGPPAPAPPAPPAGWGGWSSPAPGALHRLGSVRVRCRLIGISSVSMMRVMSWENSSPTRPHHVGIPAVGGEAGDGVHLVKDDLPRRGQEQVHPGKAPCSRGPDGLGGRWIFRACWGAIRAGSGWRRFSGVLLLVVKEALGQLDLVHRPPGLAFGCPAPRSPPRSPQWPAPAESPGRWQRRRPPPRPAAASSVTRVMPKEEPGARA